MPTNVCLNLPSKRNLPHNQKRKPTTKPSASSRRTSASYSLPPHWDRSGYSPSIPVSVPVARLFVSTLKVICCIMKTFIRILRSARPMKPLRNSVRWSKPTRSKLSPSATEQPAAKRRTLSTNRHSIVRFLYL